MEDQAERFLDELKRIDLLDDEQASQYRPRSVYLDPVFASFRNNDGDTLLHTAVEEGIGGGVVFLLQDETWRALVNTRNKAGQAPLYILSQSCEKLLKKSDGEDQIKKILKALLDKGADINIQDKNGWTPLHKAINIASSFMVDQILAADNVDVDRRTIYQGATPLHMAVDRALVGIMKSLIEKGADLTLTTHSGQSILHWALASAKFMEDEDKASIFGDAELVDDSPRASRGPSRAGTTKSQPPTPRHEKPMSYEDESTAFGDARFVVRLPRASGGPSGSGMENPKGQTPRDDKSKGDEDQASTFGNAGSVDDLPHSGLLLSRAGIIKSQTQTPRHDRYTSSYANYGTDYGDESSRGGAGLRNQNHVLNALRLPDNMNTDDSENDTIMSRIIMIISILKGPDIWFQLLQIAYREPDQELVQFACHTLYPPPTESKWPVVRQLWMAMREDRFKGLESELRAKVRGQMQSRGPLIQVLTRDIDSWNALDLATYLDLPQVVRWLLRSKRWTKSEKEAAIRRGNGRDLAMDKPIWNEPFAQYTGTGRQKYRYPLKRSIKVEQLATKFQSSVLDVYSDSNRFGFIYHSSKVQELLYTGENAKGPEPSMNARVKHLSEKVPGFDDSTYRDSSFRFRWIHLPANCIQWMMDAAIITNREKGKQLDEITKRFQFLENSWHELPESGLEAKYMHPNCSRSDVPVIGNKQETNEMEQATGQLALYIPYIKYAPQPRNAQDILDECKGKESQDLQLPFHRSQTLDTYYHGRGEIAKERDCDQVVSRYVARQKRESIPGKLSLERGSELEEMWKGNSEILHVGQLWLWVVDDKTIITGTSHHPEAGTDSVFERILNRLSDSNNNFNREAALASTDTFVKFIFSFYVNIVDNLTLDIDFKNLEEDITAYPHVKRERNFSTMLFGEREDESEELEKLEEIPADNSQHISVDAIFASSIEKVNKNENDLRNSFRKQIISTSSGIASKETNGIHRAVAEATEALTEIKDIRGELNMIRSVVRTQQRVWDQLFNRSSGRDENPENPQNINSWKSTDPSYVLSRIQSLLEFAEETERNVESVLDLRMNQLNLNEAENSRKQGETIMVFTVVTVIFVPLSFLTSLFALNISVFPHAGDNVLYQPGLVFGSLFGTLAGFTFIVWAVVRLSKPHVLRRLLKKPGKLLRKGKSSKPHPDDPGSRRRSDYQTEEPWYASRGWMATLPRLRQRSPSARKLPQ